MFLKVCIRTVERVCGSTRRNVVILFRWWQNQAAKRCVIQYHELQLRQIECVMVLNEVKQVCGRMLSYLHVERHVGGIPY